MHYNSNNSRFALECPHSMQMHNMPSARNPNQHPWLPLSTLFFSFSYSSLSPPLPTSTNLKPSSNQLSFPPPLHPTSMTPHQPPTSKVTKPIRLPKTQPCVYPILQHDFSYTYGKPPVLANYTPPSRCPSHDFSKIVLEWNATCKGRQFDWIFGIWLDRVELLRSCTAEPRATGIVWSVKKDITRYYSLLVKNGTQSLAVYLGNLVDRTYPGVYHVDISVY
ncbi:hypothetical protein SLE2022_337330 [Rubroshorea leprosula]